MKKFFIISLAPWIRIRIQEAKILRIQRIRILSTACNNNKNNKITSDQDPLCFDYDPGSALKNE